MECDADPWRALGSLLCWNGNFLEPGDEGRVPLYSYDAKEQKAEGWLNDWRGGWFWNEWEGVCRLRLDFPSLFHLYILYTFAILSSTSVVKNKYLHLHFDITQLETGLVSRCHTDITVLLKLNYSSVYNCEALMSTQLIIIKHNTACNEVCLQRHGVELCESQHCRVRTERNASCWAGLPAHTRAQPARLTGYLQCETCGDSGFQNSRTPQLIPKATGSHLWPSLCLLCSEEQRASIWPRVRIALRKYLYWVNRSQTIMQTKKLIFMYDLHIRLVLCTHNNQNYFMLFICKVMVHI